MAEHLAKTYSGPDAATKARAPRTAARARRARLPAARARRPLLTRADRGVARQVRWAMAGRDRAKLEATRAALAKKLPAAADVPILEADISDPASLDKMLSTAKVVLTLAGPYAKVGAPLVAAAVRCQTDYCDITGARSAG